MKLIPIIIAMLSGLIGVIVGAIIQIIYNNRLEKEKLLNDYKKICLTEWLLLNKNLTELLENPKKHNSTIFRQLIIQKKEILSFISSVNQKKYRAKILALQDLISEMDEKISLGDYEEEALNIGGIPENQKKLVREVYTLTNKVTKKISEIK